MNGDDMEFTSLKKNFELYQSEYEEAVLRSVRSGQYILGPELEQFEERFAEYLGVKHCVGMNSGTDALILGIRALGIGPGDEVIVSAGTYIASVLGITENGATPVYVDSNPETLLMNTGLIESVITKRTKAIIPVHLYGQTCNMDEVISIASKYGLYILEDCAQCHGSMWKGVKVGTLGTLAAFSFYPTKPLGAFGDAGAIVTNDDQLADRLRMLRNYGSRVKYHNETIGRNSRLDEIQAAVLNVGLNHMDEMTKSRQRIARAYIDRIVNSKVKVPLTDENSTNVYHLFPVLVDDQQKFQAFLQTRGVNTQVHYPIPPYVADCYIDQGYEWDSYPVASYIATHEVSLPIYSGMEMGDVDRVIDAVNEY